jgi:hypothetical protein
MSKTFSKTIDKNFDVSFSRLFYRVFEWLPLGNANNNKKAPWKFLPTPLPRSSKAPTTKKRFAKNTRRVYFAKTSTKKNQTRFDFFYRLFGRFSVMVVRQKQHHKNINGPCQSVLMVRPLHRMGHELRGGYIGVQVCIGGGYVCIGGWYVCIGGVSEQRVKVL